MTEKDEKTNAKNPDLRDERVSDPAGTDSEIKEDRTVETGLADDASSAEYSEIVIEEPAAADLKEAAERVEQQKDDEGDRDSVRSEAVEISTVEEADSPVEQAEEISIKEEAERINAADEMIGEFSVPASDHPDLHENPNEIDEFTKRLLNKKTEFALYPDDGDEKPEETAPMSEEERLEAEHTLSNALDELRKQRGQVPIEDEEDEFAWEQIHFEDRFKGGDDFTTESLFAAAADAGALQPEPETLQETENTGIKKRTQKSKEDYVIPSEKRPETEPARKKKTARKKTGTAAGSSAAVSGGSKKPVKKRSSRKKQRRVRKQAVALIAGLVGLILLLFFGYYYKTQIYDPQNTVSAEQQAAYDRLLAYAEEYSMSSDAEKRELLSMESDYNSLSAKQKEELNKKFEANTGKTFPDLLNELRSSDGEINSEEDETYQSLLEYASGYNSLDETQKNDIVNRKSAFDSLSTALKDNINQAMQSQTGKTFTEVYDEVYAAQQQAIQEQQQENNADASEPSSDDQNADGSNAAQPDSSSSQAAAQSTEDANMAAARAEYQQRIDENTALRDDYLAALAEEGLSADGDEVVQEYNDAIAYWTGLLNSTY